MIAMATQNVPISKVLQKVTPVHAKMVMMVMERLVPTLMNVIMEVTNVHRLQIVTIR